MKRLFLIALFSSVLGFSTVGAEKGSPDKTLVGAEKGSPIKQLSAQDRADFKELTQSLRQIGAENGLTNKELKELVIKELIDTPHGS